MFEVKAQSFLNQHSSLNLHGRLRKLVNLGFELSHLRLKMRQYEATSSQINHSLEALSSKLFSFNNHFFPLLKLSHSARSRFAVVPRECDAP